MIAPLAALALAWAAVAVPPRGAVASPADDHGHVDDRADGHADEHADGHADAPTDEHADEHDDHADDAARFTVADFERHGVEVATATAGTVDIGVELPAEVRPNGDRVAHLAPRFPGVVRQVRKSVGDRVAAGEVLAVIESDNLTTYELRSAFAGTVIDRHIAPGESVTRETPAFIVADLATVWVNINVYQKVLPAIRVGQRVTIATRHDDREASGEISYIAPVVDQATRTAIARVVLDNPDGHWRPGLFVVATVAQPVAAEVVVARRALHEFDGERAIFVAVGEHFVARHVVVGELGRTTASIESGVAAGERYADEGSFLVKADLAKSAAEHQH
jgi:cobalt-zinc-cadmium efflux system membrane fusion protein